MARTMTAEGAWWLAKTYGIPAHWTVRSNEWRKLGFRFEVHGEIVARLADMGWTIESSKIDRLPEGAEVIRAGAEARCPRCGLAYIDHLPVSLVEARREQEWAPFNGRLFSYSSLWRKACDGRFLKL